MARQTITFVLDTGRDRDVLRWLQGQENKSAAIREAIRAHLAGEAVTLADVYEAVLDLQRCCWPRLPDAQSTGAPTSEEPPDVAAALDSLGI
jgi:hypothetical protein